MPRVGPGSSNDSLLEFENSALDSSATTAGLLVGLILFNYCYPPNKQKSRKNPSLSYKCGCGLVAWKPNAANIEKVLTHPLNLIVYPTSLRVERIHCFLLGKYLKGSVFQRFLRRQMLKAPPLIPRAYISWYYNIDQTEGS